MDLTTNKFLGTKSNGLILTIFFVLKHKIECKHHKFIAYNKLADSVVCFREKVVLKCHVFINTAILISTFTGCL